jgi:UPF0176 protein
LVILGPEGINTTLSFPRDLEEKVKTELTAILAMGEFFFKDSYADKYPFHDFKIKIRPEIVTLQRTDLVPDGRPHRHLSPDEWNRVLKTEDVLLIDTRNSYEYEVGHFKGAVDPQTREFTSYPEFLKKAQVPKDKKILIYCTGGIRCEKAILEMEDQGYQNVYQLDGGILNYLEKHPNDMWEGECFVFDYRVAVDQNLNPSQTYRLCPHCGQPAKTKINCVQCGMEAICCDHCLELGQEQHTCSKNCAHHFRMGHRSKKIHHDGLRRAGGA